MGLKGKSTLKFADWCPHCLKPTFFLQSHINTEHKAKTTPVKEIMPREIPLKKVKLRVTAKYRYKCPWCKEIFSSHKRRDEHVLLDHNLQDEVSNGNDGVEVTNE